MMLKRRRRSLGALSGLQRQLKAIARMKAELEVLEKDYGQRALKNKDAERPTMRGFNIANAVTKEKSAFSNSRLKKPRPSLKQCPGK